MDKTFYLNFLDELTDRERSIFLYRIILKVPTDETAKRLKIPQRDVQDITTMLREQKELLMIKGRLIEAYDLGVMV